MPHFICVSAPIAELCKKGEPDKLVWTGQCQRALCTLKEALVKGPVLGNPDFDKPFMVLIDTPDTGLGAVLTHTNAKETHPILYLSRKLLPREQGYAAIEKQCLGLGWTLRRPQPDLFRRHFTVYTNRSPCCSCTR